MKRAVSALLALFFCLTLAACSGDPSIPEGYKLISEDDVAYRFFVPTQWSENTGTSKTSAYYSTDDRSIVMVNTYLPAEEYNSTEKFWGYIESQYMESYTNYVFVEKSEAVLGGRNALRCIFTATIGADNYKVMQVIAPYGNYYYTLTYTSTPEAFDSHLAEVDGMIEVFEFR